MKKTSVINSSNILIIFANFFSCNTSDTVDKQMLMAKSIVSNTPEILKDGFTPM